MKYFQNNRDNFHFLDNLDHQYENILFKRYYKLTDSQHIFLFDNLYCRLEDIFFYWNR